MIQVCYRCKKIYGEKEPLQDRTETHGLCEECFPKEMEMIKKTMEEHRRRNDTEIAGRGDAVNGTSE